MKDEEKKVIVDRQEDYFGFQVVELFHSNKSYKVRNTMTNAQLEKLVKLLAKAGDGNAEAFDAVTTDLKLACKAAAIYTLPGLIRLRLLYWFRWRWFYYIRQYDNIQLQPILSAGHGSTPYADFLQTWSVLSAQKVTLMNMRGEEAEKTLQRIAAKFQAEMEENGNKNNDESDSQ